MDATFALAKNVVQTKYGDIPNEVVEITKMSILDTLGVMLPASTAGEGVREIVELVKEGGGKEESTIIAFGGKVPSWMAAFANGSMTHPMDYDETHDLAYCHPTTATLPAALAIAERVGKVNGEGFITAVALGGDVVSRLGLALTKNPVETGGWATPSVNGVFAATAAAGKLLGLTEEQMLDAFGIAYYNASGSLEAALEKGSALRSIRDAFTGKTGVLSALLAQKGVTGTKNSLEGKAGLFNLYYRGDYDPVPLTADLGKRFEGANVSFKAWPSCRGTHAHVDAALGIAREHNIGPEDIEEIVLVGGDFSRELIEPLEERQKPERAIDAKFSLPFTVGVALARKRIVIADFLPEGLKDPAVLEMAKRVTWRYDPQFNGKNMRQGIVEIRAKDGMTYSKRVDFAYGCPDNPIAKDDLVTKFRDCAAYSAKPLSKDDIDQVIELVTRLEDVDDIGQVIALLS